MQQLYPSMALCSAILPVRSYTNFWSANGFVEGLLSLVGARRRAARRRAAGLVAVAEGIVAELCRGAESPLQCDVQLKQSSGMPVPEGPGHGVVVIGDAAGCAETKTAAARSTSAAVEVTRSTRMELASALVR